MPYNVGTNFYGSNPSWYIGRENKNGELSSTDKHKMDASYGEWKAVGWMPLPKPYKAETERKNEYIHKTNDTN